MRERKRQNTKLLKYKITRIEEGVRICRQGKRGNELTQKVRQYGSVVRQSESDSSYIIAQC